MPLAKGSKVSNVLIWVSVCSAEHVINSETEDIAKRVKEITGMRSYLHSKLHYDATKHLPTAHVLSVKHIKTAVSHTPDACALSV